MEDHNAAAGQGDVEAARNALGRFCTKLPQFALNVLGVGFVQVLQPNIFHHLHEAQQPSLQSGRKSLDLGVHDVEGVNRSLHMCYIARMI